MAEEGLAVGQHQHAGRAAARKSGPRCGGGRWAKGVGHGRISGRARARRRAVLRA